MSVPSVTRSLSGHVRRLQPASITSLPCRTLSQTPCNKKERSGASGAKKAKDKKAAEPEIKVDLAKVMEERQRKKILLRRGTNLLDLYGQNTGWIGKDYRQFFPKEWDALTEDQLMQQLKLEEGKLQRDYMFPEIGTVPWTFESRRVGAIGILLGATIVWSKDGERKWPATMVAIRDCHVIDSQLSIEDGGKDVSTQMILGALEEDMEGMARMSAERLHWFEHRGIFPKRKWSGFHCTKDALLPVGTAITAGHFQPGQQVRTKMVSFDYGFQGVMKRWGMKGQPASHGQTKTHRKMGATGGGQDPGRIWPGKKMPGHMGGKYTTVRNSQKVLRLNTAQNVMYIEGILPGHVGGYVKIFDAHGLQRDPKKAHKKKQNFRPENPPPFPTLLPGAVLPEHLFAENVYDFTDVLDGGEEGEEEAVEAR